MIASLHAADGSEVWDEGYSDSLTNFFDIERQLVGDLVQAIGVELTDADKARLAQVPTESVEAFSAYAQGRMFLERQDRPRADITAAIGFLEEAVDADPQFVLAHAGLGDAHWAQFRETNDSD